eukprot:scaffold405952_cov24-Attheya_sp.AAC.1
MIVSRRRRPNAVGAGCYRTAVCGRLRIYLCSYFPSQSRHGRFYFYSFSFYLDTRESEAINS